MTQVAIDLWSSEDLTIRDYDIKPSDIAVSGLSKSFDRQKSILKNIDLDVKHGEAVALIGSNGAGKSTLLLCILRLIEPSSGSIRLLDSEITRLKKKDLRKIRAQVGFVWQRHNLVPRLSAITNVIHGAQGRCANPRLWCQSLAPREIRQEALHWLDVVGLANLADRRVDQLSGGESQRVSIARALMQHPKIMMADEPAASLDPIVGEEVMEFFVDLIHNENLTLLFTSHNLDQALTYSDRVLGLRNGHIELNAWSKTLDKNSLRGIYGRTKRFAA